MMLDAQYSMLEARIMYVSWLMAQGSGTTGAQDQGAQGRRKDVDPHLGPRPLGPKGNKDGPATLAMSHKT